MCVCVCVCVLGMKGDSTLLFPVQKSMMLEDVNDVEFRKLRSKVSSLSLENKNLSTKNSSQKEQSKSPS